MGRGVHFNHKQKGHQQEKPKHGHDVLAKDTERVVYNIEPTATNGDRPLSITTEKDL
jgi:hypothetical protein